MFPSFLNTTASSTASNENNSLIYNVSHNVQIMFKATNVQTEKTVWIRLFHKPDSLVINICDSEQLTFNYTREINRNVFEAIKVDQALTISYEEFPTEIVDLLNTAVRKQLFLRLEVDTNQCRMLFYEKSKLKALILLVIDLYVISEKELIKELVRQIKCYKELKELSDENILELKRSVAEKEETIREINRSCLNKDATFLQDLKKIDYALSSNLQNLKCKVDTKLIDFHTRLEILLQNIADIKTCNDLKCESSNRLLETMQELRLDNEQHVITVENLNKQIELLKLEKNRNNDAFVVANAAIAEKERDISILQAQVKEITNDIQKSTSVIKSLQGCNDELSKDLFKANQMLVSYNSHYEEVNRENNELKDQVSEQKALVEESNKTLTQCQAEFDIYKEKYNQKEFDSLNQALNGEKVKNVSLERKVRELGKLNELLSTRLAGQQSRSDIKSFNHSAKSVTSNLPSSTLGDSTNRHYHI